MSENKKKLSHFFLQNKKEIAFYAFIFFIVIGFFWIAHLRISGFLLNSGDTAVDEQAIWNTIHGNFFHESFLGTPTNFSEHLNFIQFLYLPFYAIFQNLLTLYAIINLIYGAAAVILFQHVKKRLGFIAGAIFALFFLLQPIVIIQNIDTMRPVAVGAPLLLLSFIFYEQKKYKWWLIFLLITAFTTEFIAPTIFLFGLIPLIDRRSWKWIWPPFISGAVMYIASALFVSIGFSKQDSQFQLFNLSKIMAGRLKTRFGRLRDVLRPGLYILPFFSKYSILLIPTIILDMVIVDINRLFPGSHLLSLAPPIIVFSILDLVEHRFIKYKKFVMIAMVAGILLSIPIWRKTASVVPNERAASMRQATYFIKDKGSVTSARIMGIFVDHRKDFYLVENQNYSDYILLDKSRDEYKKNRKNEYFQTIENSEDYLEIMDENDIGVFIRKKKIAELLGKSEQDIDPSNRQEILKELNNLKPDISLL